jgi:hypothetical protein
MWATFIAVLVLIGSMVTGLVIDGGASWPLSVSDAAREGMPRVRVEVLNGSSIEGLARRVTDRLRDAGFDVVYYGNAGGLRRDSTTILDRSGDEAAVERLAAALGVSRIESAVDTTLYLEATVVLAEDWAEIEVRTR